MWPAGGLACRTHTDVQGDRGPIVPEGRGGWVRCKRGSTSSRLSDARHCAAGGWTVSAKPRLKAPSSNCRGKYSHVAEGADPLTLSVPIHRLGLLKWLVCAKLARVTQKDGTEGDPWPHVLPRDDARHGTTNGYNNLGCRCLVCRKASTEAHREYLGRVRAEGRVLSRHGTETAYASGCRCDVCRLAHNKRSREYKRRRTLNQRRTTED